LKIQQDAAVFKSHWDAEKKLFVTRIHGLFDQSAVDNWQQELIDQSKQIPAETQFKLLLDERGYTYLDKSVHKIKRDVVPQFLAIYGFYLSILPEAEVLWLKKHIAIDEKHRHCSKIAMVHLNQTAMADLQTNYGNESEFYGSDLKEAMKWLSQPSG